MNIKKEAIQCAIYEFEKNSHIIIDDSLSSKKHLPEEIYKKLQHSKLLGKFPSPLIKIEEEEIINIKEQGYYIKNISVEDNDNHPEILITKETEHVSEIGAAIGGGILAASLGFGTPGAIAGAIIGAMIASSSRQNEKP